MLQFDANWQIRAASPTEGRMGRPATRRLFTRAAFGLADSIRFRACHLSITNRVPYLFVPPKFRGNNISFSAQEKADWIAFLSVL
jgi:hypothetical protein